MAAIVFSKVGGDGSFAMRSTSARFSAIDASSAGPRCSGRALSNGGTPAYGPDQGASNGFAAAAAEPLVISAAPAVTAPARSAAAAAPARYVRARMVHSPEPNRRAVGRRA